jgi:hypothetical protein
MKAQVLSTVLSALAAAAILATDAVATPLSPAYTGQLQRCVVALRPRVTDPAAAAVRHTVTDMRVRGVWREFVIDSDILSDDGERLGETRSRCRVERWGPAVQVRTLATRS